MGVGVMVVLVSGQRAVLAEAVRVGTDVAKLATVVRAQVKVAQLPQAPHAEGAAKVSDKALE